MLERLVDALSAGLVLVRGATIEHCNLAFARMVGAPSPAALVGETIASLVIPAHVERLQDDWGRANEVGLTFSREVECQRLDGRSTRLEIEPRPLGPDERLYICQELGGSPPHELELANRLSALALDLQRERTEDGIFRVAGSGLGALGFAMYAFELQGDHVEIRAMSAKSRFPQVFESLTGKSFLGMRFEATHLRQLSASIDQGRALFLEDTRPLIELIQPSIGESPDALSKLHPTVATRAVLLPIFVGGSRWGSLYVASNELTRRDAATLALFGAKVASALEIARTIDELDGTNRELREAQEENQRLWKHTLRRMDLLSVQYQLSRTIAGWVEEEAMAERALGVLTRGLNADAGWICAFRDQGCRILGVQAPPDLPLQERLATWLADEGHERVFSTTVAGEVAPGWKAMLDDTGLAQVAAQPLVMDERTVGALVLCRRNGPGFDEEEVQALESSAASLAVAVERCRLFAEERSRVQVLSRLNELGNLFAQELDLPSLLELAIEHVHTLIEAPIAFVSLLDPDGDRLRLVASSLDHSDLIGDSIDREGDSIAAMAVRELRPVIVEDAQTDARASRKHAIRHGVRSMIAAPLISRGEPIGALTMAADRPGHHFEPADADRLVAIANQLAAAIANARLLEQERARVRELSLLSEIGRIASGTLHRDVLLAECVGHVQAALDFDRGAAWVVHRGALEPAFTPDDVPEFSILGPLAERALKMAVPLAEETGAGHACAVPLLAGSEAGGVLVFARRDRAVGDEELRTLAAAAPELGVALQNARLFDAVSRRADELRLLLDIGRAITGTLDLDSVLDTSAGILSRFIDGSNAFILLVDPSNSTLRGAACSNVAWRDDFRDVRIDLEDPGSLAAACVRSREPVVVNDTSQPPWDEYPWVRRFGEKSVLVVPLLVREEPIGCVLVDDTRSPRDWTSAEIERAMVIAHQVAIAVANAHLYDDLKRSYGELARTQEELVKRERLAALGELAAVVAHEVRNPLGVIFNSLGSLRRLLRPTGDGAMLLDIVEEEADRLDRMVHDLLDFARPNEPALEAEPVDGLLRDALQVVRPEQLPAQVHFDLDLAPNLPPVLIDARMIRQVLSNLVLNGVQAMPRGGTLRIRARRDGASMVRIELRDSGSGIPAELSPRIFEPFFTTKAAGTGLGLAVVKRFVDAHRGTISFQSGEEGTTFVLRLPVDQESQRHQTGEASPEESR